MRAARSPATIALAHTVGTLSHNLFTPPDITSLHSRTPNPCTLPPHPSSIHSQTPSLLPLDPPNVCNGAVHLPKRFNGNEALNEPEPPSSPGENLTYGVLWRDKGRRRAPLQVYLMSGNVEAACRENGQHVGLIAPVYNAHCVLPFIRMNVRQPVISRNLGPTKVMTIWIGSCKQGTLPKL